MSKTLYEKSTGSKVTGLCLHSIWCAYKAKDNCFITKTVEKNPKTLKN